MNLKHKIYELLKYTEKPSTKPLKKLPFYRQWFGFTPFMLLLLLLLLLSVPSVYSQADLLYAPDADYNAAAIVDSTWLNLYTGSSYVTFRPNKTGAYRAELHLKNYSTGTNELPQVRVKVGHDNIVETENIMVVQDSAWYPILDLQDLQPNTTITVSLDNDRYLSGFYDINVAVEALFLSPVVAYDTFYAEVSVSWQKNSEPDLSHYNVKLKTPDLQVFTDTTVDTTYIFSPRFAQHGIYYAEVVTVDSTGNKSAPGFNQTIVPFEQIFRPVSTPPDTTKPDTIAPNPIRFLKTIITFSRSKQ